MKARILKTVVRGCKALVEGRDPTRRQFVLMARNRRDSLAIMGDMIARRMLLEQAGLVRG